MIDDAIIHRVRDIGAEMRETISRFDYGLNQNQITDQVNHLADEAVSACDYHDYIFEKCNVIRSHASSFKNSKSHLKEIKEAFETVAKLEHWNPDDAKPAAIETPDRAAPTVP